MKSPPGRSVVTTSSSTGSVSRGATGALAGPAGAAAAGQAPSSAPPSRRRLPRAAPVTAALFRKSRRSTELFLAIPTSSLGA